MISLLYSRGAGHIAFDPAGHANREKRDHMMYLGPSGSGGKCVDAFEVLEATMELATRTLVEPGAQGDLL